MPVEMSSKPLEVEVWSLGRDMHLGTDSRAGI